MKQGLKHPMNGKKVKKMIKIKKVNDPYRECNICCSKNNVASIEFIRPRNRNSTEIVLCEKCLEDLNEGLKNYIEGRR